MPSSPNGQLSAWITIDDEKLTEYDVHKVGKTMTCWIPSELGKTFSVHWKNDGFKKNPFGEIAVDGIDCAGMVIESNSLPFSAECSGMRGGATYRPFIFSALKLTDDDDFLEQPLNKNFGSIVVRIYPVKFLAPRRRVRGSGASEPGPSLPKLTVHERSKKASAHQITLGTWLTPSRRRRIELRRAGPDVVKFCFKYCPLDLLQANGIAPAPEGSKRLFKRKKTPTPEPESSDEEDEEDLANEAEMRALRTRVKSEPRVIDLTRPKKRVKLEGGRSQPFTGEVIDLT
ncbi:hypothetical protein FB45DRAFT_732843 [Roridomyces roridus]|uniref:DUF7918 domain-containing protein n=1 Tax=Roridomyces roridus TaxID=1738132 RepID=A0AAD7FZL9_9AGAR|nr:hypothetical protein FB45DRAFT_732843 [Roridomyces roridus]